MSESDEALDLITVNFGDELRVLAPADWSGGGLEDGRWWCGDRDRMFTCYFRHEIAPASDPPGHPLDNARRCLDIMRRHFERQGMAGAIDERRTISGGLIRVITDDPEPSGVVYRHARWYLATGFSNGVSIFHVTLAALVENWEDRMAPRLIDHFAAQAAAGTGTKSLITQDLGLRDLRIGGPVVVGIPATWSVRQDDERIVVHGPDGLPELVARVGWDDDEAVLSAISEAAPAKNFSELAERGLRAATALARILAVAVSSIDRAEYGAIIAGEIDEPGAANQQSVWYYVIPIDNDGYFVVGFELAIPAALRDRPDMVEVKAMVAREISKLRLESDDD